MLSKQKVVEKVLFLEWRHMGSTTSNINKENNEKQISKAIYSLHISSAEGKEGMFTYSLAPLHLPSILTLSETFFRSSRCLWELSRESSPLLLQTNMENRSTLRSDHKLWKVFCYSFSGNFHFLEEHTQTNLWAAPLSVYWFFHKLPGNFQKR